MQTKTFALLAVSASAAVASPLHHHMRDMPHVSFHHGTGTGRHGVRPTGSAGPFPHVNDTNGFFPSTTTMTDMQTVTNLFTVTISPTPAASEPVTFGNNVEGAEASCTSTSIATQTSINYITVTASPEAANKAAASANPGAFYGGGSQSWGGGRPNWGNSQAPAAPSAANPTGVASSYVATTFATATGAASATGAVPSASASNAPVSGGSGGGKRGISYNTASLVGTFGNAVSWAYNWAATADGNPGVEFVPMMWGLNNVDSFASQAGSASHVLSFNEPDLGEQANIDPATAAKQHIAGMKSLVGKAQIGSPAITNGDQEGPNYMGVPWLNQWFKECAGQCPVDFVAFHWYAPANNFAYFQSHVESVVAAAQANGVNKVWLTEFAPSGSQSDQAAFMKQAIPYLDSNPAVERYAGFMASDGTMLSGSSLNDVGAAYAGSS